jgi:hypothetical protein
MKQSIVAYAAAVGMDFAAGLGMPRSAPSQGAGACGRACLNAFTDRYLEARHRRLHEKHVGPQPDRVAVVPLCIIRER